jgi:hypothetical protein
MMNPNPTVPPSTSLASASWSAAEEAVANICGGKGNFNHLWQLIHALCALGLGGLVEPALDTIKLDAPAWQAQRKAVLEQAQKLAHGGVSWQSRARLFSNNVAALAAANPSLENLHEFWRENQDRYALFQANDGNFQILDQREPVVFAGFVGGLTDHRALTRFWTYQCVGYQMPNPIAFDGAGYGWVLERVLETTHRTLHSFSCAVYVVEPDLASACMLLNLHDLTRWQNRLRFFAGPQAQQQFEDGLRCNRHWNIPSTMVSERIQQREPLNLNASTEAVTKIRIGHDASLLSEVEAHYAKLTIADWADRFENAASAAGPLKVLGMTSRYSTVLQYSMDELGEAIRAAGHEFILCKEPDDQCAQVPELQMIHEHQPDLLVSISRMRFENKRVPKNVPALCWDQDNLPCMRNEAAGKSIDELTYIAGYGARFGYQELGWPRENCILAFQAAATHRYHNGPVERSLIDKHRCTFSYTSNASGSVESLVEELRRGYAADAGALAVFDHLTHRLLTQAKTGFAWDTVQTAKLLDAAIQSQKSPLSASTRQQLLIHLRSVSDRAFRHVALGWVAEYCRKNKTTLRLYGNGWESNPRFAEFAAGFLPPGEEVRALYQASDINLQIFEAGFLHSRSLDGLAAGGFFLYRLAPEARDLDGTEKARLIMTRRALETGCLTYGQLDASTDPLIVEPWAYARSVIRLGNPNERCPMLDIWNAAPSEETQFPYLDEITFDGEAQFNEMTDRYLANPDLRRSVAAKLRQVVVDRFSYDARWKQFLSGIAAGLRHAADAKKTPAVVPQAA